MSSRAITPRRRAAWVSAFRPRSASSWRFRAGGGVIGDGSSIYSIQALYTAARYEVAVPILVINNRGYSILKGFLDAVGVQDVPGLDLPDIDIVQIARGFGCEGVRVENQKTYVLPSNAPWPPKNLTW